MSLINMYEEKPSSYAWFLRYGSEVEHEVRYIVQSLSGRMQEAMQGGLPGSGWYVLDLGAGEGSKSVPIAAYLQRQGTVEYTVLDPSAAQLKRLRKKAGQARIQNIRFINQPWEVHEPDRQYEFIFCLHAFYHFADWHSALQKLLKALSPNGQALISLLTPENISYTLNQELCRRLGEPPRNDLHHAQEFSTLLRQERVPFVQENQIEPFNLQAMKQQSREGIETLEFIISRPLDSLPPGAQDWLFERLQNYPEQINNEVSYFWIAKP